MQLPARCEKLGNIISYRFSKVNIFILWEVKHFPLRLVFGWGTKVTE